MAHRIHEKERSPEWGWQNLSEPKVTSWLVTPDPRGKMRNKGLEFPSLEWADQISKEI